MFNFFKKHFFMQDSASWFLTRIPVLVEHNVSKYGTNKKAFYLTALEQLGAAISNSACFRAGLLYAPLECTEDCVRSGK